MVEGFSFFARFEKATSFNEIIVASGRTLILSVIAAHPSQPADAISLDLSSRFSIVYFPMGGQPFWEIHTAGVTQADW